MNKIIDGKSIRDQKKKEFASIIENLEELTLAVISVGSDPASEVYVKNKGKLCGEVRITFKHIKYDNITEEDLISKIEELNTDDKITGILVQLPLPKAINEKNVIEAISPNKDVDGLTSKNIGNLYADNEAIVPCTALGVIEILKSINTPLEGANVTIIGRSKLVGLPLIKLFMNENSTVTVCHSKTKKLEEITSKADILVVAIGKKQFITEKHIKEGAIVIDVGITRENGKLYGDCDFEKIQDKCKYITPVPGGVGPLTVVMLINNIIKAHQITKNKKQKHLK